ncbi:flagellar biosynthesis protein FlhB [Paenibacillus thailandensis]|uniref:Flagellar biosynthetic protein FlhB n=1 Tax=Paenibacillus thailandensis TaxID=393250 RepID=A0ABW5QXE4_9BACL
MRTYRLRLDLQLFSQEKTERATPKKRQESRQKGQVAKSPELPASLSLLFCFLCFIMLGGYFKERILQLFGSLFQDWITMELTVDNVMKLSTQIVIDILLLIAPLLAVTVVFAVVGNVVQFGFLLTGEPLKMKLSKLDPIKGFKNIFSMHALVEFFKSILKVAIIAVCVYVTIRSEWTTVLALWRVPVEQIFGFAADLTMKLGLAVSAVLVVLGFGDYMYKRYEHEKSIRMSKQDIKDEYKKTEGNPLIKGRIRERQRKMALQRMMQEVPKADVIITNPTHFAIALKYDAGRMEAPVIVAKGVDYVAQRIKEIARENGVITMENKPLARALYERADIGDSIPADLFQAVAEVLAYVYKVKGRRK